MIRNKEGLLMKRMMRLLSLVLCLMLVQQTAFAAIPEDYVVRHGDRESKKNRDHGG